MQTTKDAARAREDVVGGSRDYTSQKRAMHRRNRRVIRQALAVGKDISDLERRVTARDIS